MGGLTLYRAQNSMLCPCIFDSVYIYFAPY